MNSISFSTTVSQAHYPISNENFHSCQLPTDLQTICYLLFAGASYGAAFILITTWASKKHFAEVTQQLNANVANHLIDEKFTNSSPFLEDGSINKPLFGDIMHDMMAVNRSIEVYLIDDLGNILYSVVLDHEPGTPVQQIDLQPITQFIEANGEAHILGDDPRNSGGKRSFLLQILI